MVATDEQLHKLLEDLETWKQKLPENLRFNVPTRETPLVILILRNLRKNRSESLHSPGLLYMLMLREYDLLACVHADFLHVPCSSHISLTVEKWTNLVKLTGDVIDWLDKHEPCMTLAVTATRHLLRFGPGELELLPPLT